MWDLFTSDQEGNHVGLEWLEPVIAGVVKKKIYNHAFCECTASVYYTVYIVTSGGETFQRARAEWHNLFCWGKVITTFLTGSWTFSPHNNFPLEEQSSLWLISLAKHYITCMQSNIVFKWSLLYGINSHVVRDMFACKIAVRYDIYM